MDSKEKATLPAQSIELEQAVSDTLERILAPVAEIICEMERLRRKEYLTEHEVALLFSLSAATLRTRRARGSGPRYSKDGGRVLYARKDVFEYLEDKVHAGKPVHGSGDEKG